MTQYNKNFRDNHKEQSRLTADTFSYNTSPAADHIATKIVSMLKSKSPSFPHTSPWLLLEIELLRGFCLGNVGTSHLSHPDIFELKKKKGASLLFGYLSAR